MGYVEWALGHWLELGGTFVEHDLDASGHLEPMVKAPVRELEDALPPALFRSLRRRIVSLGTEGIRRLAEIAFAVNEKQENIGARRLYTVMERLLDEVSFDAAKLDVCLSGDQPARLPFLVQLLERNRLMLLATSGATPVLTLQDPSITESSATELASGNRHAVRGTGIAWAGAAALPPPPDRARAQPTAATVAWWLRIGSVPPTPPHIPFTETCRRAAVLSRSLPAHAI